MTSSSQAAPAASLSLPRDIWALPSQRRTYSWTAAARKDGGLNVELEGKVVVVDRKVKLRVKQHLFPGATTLDLVVESGGSARGHSAAP